MARGGPRDLANLRDGVKAARSLREGLRQDALGGEAAQAVESLTQNIAAVSRLSDRVPFMEIDARHTITKYEA